MRLDFLRALERKPGPYVSVYLATARDGKDAQHGAGVLLRFTAA